MARNESNLSSKTRKEPKGLNIVGLHVEKALESLFLDKKKPVWKPIKAPNGLSMNPEFMA
jgi:hypothetical protein